MDSDDVLQALLLVGGVILIFGCTIIFAFLSNTASCNSQWASFEHRYDFFGGCILHVDGKDIPADQYYLKADAKQ